ncbi:MAG: hypothetical protein ACK54C_14880 [Betaproteobacteria bacterium]|jgi:hypothetical protein
MEPTAPIAPLPAMTAAPAACATRGLRLAQGVVDRVHGRQHDATVQALAPQQVAQLLEQCENLSPAARTTRLLAAAVRAVGPCSPLDEALARQLTAGDREALLLALHDVQFGGRMHARLACPHCVAALELDLAVDELLLPDRVAASLPPCEVADPQAGMVRLQLRLPTGADLEQAAHDAAIDPDAATRALLERCVQSACDLEGRAVSLSAPLLQAAADAIAAGDPQAEIALVLDCPQCSARFEALFDTARFVFDRLEAMARDFWREVHDIATRYHWSESDIVALPPSRRRRYLQMIRSEAA